MLHIIFRQIEAYLDHRLINHIIFQLYSAIFTTLNILRHICPHQVYFGRCRHIQDPGILVLLDMFMYITACSELYSGLIQVLRKTIDAYSESQSDIQTDSDIFSTLACLSMKYFSHIQAYSQQSMGWSLKRWVLWLRWMNKN